MTLSANTSAPSADETILLQRGLRFHQEGKLREAMGFYQQLLHRQPGHAQALSLMGIAAHQLGDLPLAERLLGFSLARHAQNADAAMNLASIYHATGRSAEGLALLKQTVAAGAVSPELWVTYGHLALQCGMPQDAIAHYSQALTMKPNWQPALMHLGMAYKAAGQLAEAETSLLRAVALDAQDRGCLTVVAELFMECGKHEQALAHYSTLLAQNPCADAASIHAAMGVAQLHLRAWEDAIAHSREALAREPENPAYLSNLANAVFSKSLAQGGDSGEAEALYRRAVAASNAHAHYLFNLGTFYFQTERWAEAEEILRQAIAQRPEVDGPYINLAAILQKHGRLMEAEALLLEALRLFPQSANAYLNLGNIYKDSGRHREGMDSYRAALALEPNWAVAHSNYVFSMHYDAESTPADILRETLAWAERHTDAIAARCDHSNTRDPDRILRIGYVSADFRNHPVMAYLEPVLRSHDKTRFEIYAYSANRSADAVTERVRGYVDHWRDIALLSDTEAAACIGRDAIDILIDLSGHTAGNRLRVFAYKPAPIQASWIGYFNTTGVKAIDYFISDRFLLPPEDEWQFTEKPLRLPTTGAPYQLREPAIPIGPLPALARGYVTFGSFNALAKITAPAIALWAKILARVPGAKLYLKNQSFGDEAVREEFRQLFAAHGVDAGRLEFSGLSPLNAYLAEYNTIDIALDTFPYNAATTALDTLWMGVPMITLRGDRLAAHVGESMLNVVGLSDCVAADQASYVEKAVALAGDLERVNSLRRTLRTTLEASPMTNATLFTHGFEDALRAAWRAWCAR